MDEDAELRLRIFPNSRMRDAANLGWKLAAVLQGWGGAQLLDSYEAEREQWNDANNVLTVRPGVVVGYERNTYTNEKYDKAGITVLPIPGEELGRGRGGARCMSCPMERDGI